MDLLDKVGMQKCKAVVTPMTTSDKLLVEGGT
jgi:hypothetical protein